MINSTRTLTPLETVQGVTFPVSPGGICVQFKRNCWVATWSPVLARRRSNKLFLFLAPAPYLGQD